MKATRTTGSRASARTFATIASVLVLSLFAALPAAAAPKKKFDVCWSIYVGWMPWDYLSQSGIMKKWADKYGIEVKITQINDYVESINQYTAGRFDGCSMTNMDALTIPAAGGVDTTALIVGDFSNGNDGVVLKGAKALPAIKGRKVNLVELSVSHYLLARGLESVGLSEKDVTTVNTSDADIVAAYASPDATAVVTWNPQLAEVSAMPGSTLVFDSSRIPGEIIDLMVVNTRTLADNPAFGKALVGAWYEVLALMSRDDAAGKAARTAMAQAAGTDLAGFQAQLKSTRMFYAPADAVAFATGAQLPETMKKVAAFSFAHGLMGEGARDAEAIGMLFPGGVQIGAKGNVKLRFDAGYMSQAAQGKL
ncbi:MAG: putative urea ABC transporter substrate-binding protein [Gammaproteobacteria bacterium]